MWTLLSPSPASLVRTLRVIGTAGVLVAALCLPGVAGSANAAPSPTTAAPASYVDPMIGTGSGGAMVGSVNEYPGPDAPFGMIQWGPVTGPVGSVVGYNSSDTTIDGFSLTRLGGVGCSIFGDFEFLPTDQAVSASPGSIAGWDSHTSRFSHGDETAKAGYYSVTTANGIKTELTSATRAALGRFTYPAGSPATMLINASSSYDGDGDTLRIASDDEITGSATGGEFCGHTTQRYTVYFSVTFDRPFSSHGTWEGATATPGSSSASGTAAGGWVNFAAASSGPTVIGAKVAISYVSVAGAQSNQATIGTNFGTVRAQAYQDWNQLLGKIDVSGGTGAEESTFYTALYHALLDPSIVSDADGRYRGFDFKVHTTPRGHAEYSDFSGWDIYRSEVPLLALLVPGPASDMMQSLVDAAEQGGWLPKWPTADVYTGMMGGDASDPVIADAYAFGARDFDVKTALRYMLKGADDITSPAGQGDFVPRSDYTTGDAYDNYLDDGFIPSGPDTATFGTSLTEEDAVADFSIGQFAADIGDPSGAAAFAKRGQNWQNILDPATGYVMPRGPQAPLGGDPATQTEGFEEGDAAQYTWMVPQNLPGLFTALGGDSVVNSDLDSYFSRLEAGPDAPNDWAGNEVTLNDPWEYDYTGEPWKTQDVVREIITQLYGPTPGGEPGNDDLGAMSSWYVWAALGMYPETPGTSTLTLGSPLFPDTVIHEGNGHTITVNAPQAAADAPYVQSLTVNGRAWTGDYLTAAQYAGGTTLDYALGTAPDTTRGTTARDAPPSYAQGEASAIGFTSPWGGVTAERGKPVTVQVGAQSEVQRPQQVTWSVTAPAGLTVTPSSGTLTVGPGKRATAPLTVSGISGSLLAGQYPVSITFTGPGGAKVTTADLYVTVPPQLTLTAGQASLDVAAGASNQATYTITNNVENAARTVTLASSPGPAGVTSTLSATSVTIPPGGSEQVTTTFANPVITAGTGAYTITADDVADGYTVTGATRLTYTSDLALNTYRTPYPAPSATSTATGSSPYLAVDGGTTTSWVSGAVPTASAPVDFEEDFGAPVDIASVSVAAPANAGPAGYTIETSADGQDWTTVGTVASAAASAATTTAAAPARTTKVTPAAARYLRLAITGSDASRPVTISELDVSAQPGPITTLANEQNLNLAAGGHNQATYTITNNQAAPADVTLAGSGPSGVTAALSATSETIPVGGSATVTATFGDPGTTTGVGIYTLTATDGAGNTGTGATELYFGRDLALNAFGTPYPATSAISSQAAYPPSLATDGSTSTFWVSGGPAPTAATPLWLEVNFGSPVSLASVSVTPRPGYGSPDYTLEASADGQNWTTIAAVTDAASSGATTTAVSATGVQYLRVVMTGTYQGTGLTDQIAELSATGP